VTAGAGRGGLRRIDSDLPTDSWIVVNGLQRVRPGIAVVPQKATMTDFAAPAAASPPAVKATVTQTSASSAGKGSPVENSSGE
jgi:hypothetical protein